MIVEQKSNIVILAEYEDIIEDLLYNLDLNGVRMNVYPSVGCERITILGNTKNVRQSRQSRYYSMQIVDDDLLLCGVHLPSQMWTDERTQTLAFQSVVQDIELAEKESGIDKTVVVGDFNYPPGTYYYKGNKEKNEFWNIFDQVIVRPRLRSNFVDKELKIITKTQTVSLVTQNQHPNKEISDHLPIVFQLMED